MESREVFIEYIELFTNLSTLSTEKEREKWITILFGWG